MDKICINGMYDIPLFLEKSTKYCEIMNKIRDDPNIFPLWLEETPLTKKLDIHNMKDLSNLLITLQIWGVKYKHYPYKEIFDFVISNFKYFTYDDYMNSYSDIEVEHICDICKIKIMSEIKFLIDTLIEFNTNDIRNTNLHSYLWNKISPKGFKLLLKYFKENGYK